jgi:hypothetical protein
MQNVIRDTLTAGAAALLAALASVVVAQPVLDLPPVSDNAALQYWQAFATRMPLSCCSNPTPV